MCLKSQGRAGGEGWSAAGWLGPPGGFCCWPSRGGSSVLVLWWFWVWRVVVCGCSRYINIKVGGGGCWFLD